MSTASTHHLAAVWFADLVGYTRLSAENESAALRLVRLLQEVAREEIERRGGRVVKFMGDAVLAEFTSTDVAVRCALALQRDFTSRSTAVGLPGTLRIGVHVGDVVGTPDGDIYGDGVNIASRLQEQAEPGQVLVSENVWQQLRPRSEFHFHALGERGLKGMTARVAVFDVQMEEERASPAVPHATPPPDRERGSKATQRRIPRTRMALYGAVLVALIGLGFTALYLGRREATPEPAGGATATASLDRSIAVLPFTNLSADPENEYFSDGITEDILTRLSKIGDLRVISRTSIMRYKNTDKSLREIAGELEVAHILEGSVRRSGERVRIVAQLIDARNDQHLWAETYDRDLRDVFQIQSEIAQKIAAALEAELSPAERRRIQTQPTENLTAYDFYLQGRAYLDRDRKEANETAAQLFKRAIQLDPSFALAWAGLGDAYAVRVSRHAEPLVWADSGIVAAERAVTLAPELAEAHKALGTAYAIRGWYSKAVEPLEKAIALNPNYASAIHNIGFVKFTTGEYDEALRWLRRAAVVDPARRALRLGNIAFSYGLFGDFTRAEQVNSQVLGLQPDFLFAQRTAVLLLLLQGRYAEAVEQSQSLMARHPSDASAWTATGDAFLYAGDYQQAKRHYERAYEISPTAEVWGRHLPVRLAYTLWKLGEHEQAQRLLNELRTFAHREIERGNESPYVRYSLAAAYAIQENRPQAYRWLEEAIASGWSDYLILSQDPLLEHLRGDTEFQRLVARQRGRIEQMRQRVEREGW